MFLYVSLLVCMFVCVDVVSLWSCGCLFVRWKWKNKTESERNERNERMIDVWRWSWQTCNLKLYIYVSVCVWCVCVCGWVGVWVSEWEVRVIISGWFELSADFPDILKRRIIPFLSFRIVVIHFIQKFLTSYLIFCHSCRKYIISI